MIWEIRYKSTIESSNKFFRCIYIPVKEFIYLVQKCTLFHLLKSVITYALGGFIFNMSCWTAVEYYPEVRNTKKWMARIHHEVSNKNCFSFLNHRSVGIFKVLSNTKLTNIFESLTDIGKWFHDSLSYFFIIFYVQNSAIHALTFFFL